MNVQKLISEISQAQKQSSLLTVNRTMQIEEGTRRKDITEKQIFTYVHSDTTNNNKGKNIKKNTTNYCFQYSCSCDKDSSRIFPNERNTFITMNVFLIRNHI